MSLEKQLYDYYISLLNTSVNDLYGCVVTNNSSKHETFPLIEMRPLRKDIESETLAYSEKKFNLAYEINIYAIDDTSTGQMIDADDVLFDLADLVEQMFDSEGFNVIYNRETPNIDVDVKRRIVRTEGIYDMDQKIMFKR